MSDSNLEYPVLRVTQLDTHELNDNILLNIKQSINEDIFKYVQYHFFHKYHLEIYSALKFILWYHTYGKSGQTVAQSLLNWSYNRQSNGNNLKKIAHCLIFCLDDWFQEKFVYLIKKLLRFVLSKRKNSQNEANDEKIRTFEKFLHFINVFIKLASFLNYVMFLCNGRYLSLWERVLGLRPVYTSQQYMPQQLNSEATIREEMWYSCFTLFKLSDQLINFSRLKKRFTKTIGRKEDISIEINKLLCPLCNKEPTIAHVDATRRDSDSVNESCGHVYCYFCIQKEIQDNSQHFCSICNKRINQIEIYYKNENIY